MIPPDLPPRPEKETDRTRSSPPLNLWQRLEPAQQKWLAQQWGQLLRRMQPIRVPNQESGDVGD